MAENAERMGTLLRAELSKITNERLGAVRGRGLLSAIDIKNLRGKSAWDLCLLMRDRGLLAKPTQKHTIRLAPPLTLTAAQVMESVDIIRRSLEAMDE